MCTLLFSYGQHPDYKLILVANRDEFYGRSTEEARWWKDDKNVLAGRDVVAGGTWLGITKQGRFAAITNYRQFPRVGEYQTSRGAIVREFLTSDISAQEYLQHLEETREEYDGYNLLFGTALGLYYFSNKGERNGPVPSGLHGLSNHLLNTPWPKVEYGKNELAKLVEDGFDQSDLIKIMKNTRKAPDDALPNTGVGLDWERDLSPVFIKMDNYGTRATTILLIDKQGRVTFTEAGHVPKSDNEFTFQIG